MNNCIIENINYHHNGAAFTVRGTSTGNLFLNCDFHHMQDPYSTSPYDGADGLGITYNTSTASVNIVRNCRAWWCADDGFDTWQNDGYVEFDSCWSFYNGYIPDTFTTAGNGSGFKLGSGNISTTTVKRYIHNCLAFKNRSWGFVENDNPSNTSLYTTVVTGLTSTGIRTFTLIATDDAGATSSDSVNITTYDASIHYMTVVLKHMIGILSFSYNAPPSSLITITFSSLVNFVENPSGSWRPVATGANGSGNSSRYLPASTDGYIESDITDNAGTINNYNISMGFALSNVLTPDYVYDYLIYVEGANDHYKTYDDTNGYVDTGITASTGDKMRTERVGNTLYAKYYRGSTWSTMYTFPTTTTANLYIYAGSSDIGEIEYIVNPVGYGIV